ncbi:hypothetical protein J6590_105829, partial [Homalodisca vitripennis]
MRTLGKARLRIRDTLLLTLYSARIECMQELTRRSQQTYPGYPESTHRSAEILRNILI